MCPYQDLNPQLRYVPCLEIKPCNLLVCGMTFQPTESRQFISIFKIYIKRCISAKSYNKYLLDFSFAFSSNVCPGGMRINTTHQVTLYMHKYFSLAYLSYCKSSGYFQNDIVAVLGRYILQLPFLVFL